MNRKAVIFDMGGVLIDLDMDGCRQAYKDLLGYYRIDELLDPCHQKGIIGELEEGHITPDEYRAMVLSESVPGSQPETVDKAMWHILKQMSPYKGELLRKMMENYDLYMLSNNNGITMVRAYEIFAEAGAPIDETFKKSFLSHEMKMLKPSAAFYQEVIRQIGIPAEDMLFIDDSIHNVEGSIAAGLPAVHYIPGTDLSALLADALGDPSLKMEV
jgi:putative hydrolase of the HAD superfamily